MFYIFKLILSSVSLYIFKLILSSAVFLLNSIMVYNIALIVVLIVVLVQLTGQIATKLDFLGKHSRHAGYQTLHPQVIESSPRLLTRLSFA